MAGDGTNRIDPEQLVKAVQEIGKIRKGVSTNVDSIMAVFRKLLDSYVGDSADDIAAVAGQLRRSSSDIITVLAKYEIALTELAGIYVQVEKTTSSGAGKLKFGGMK